MLFIDAERVHASLDYASLIDWLGGSTERTSRRSRT